MQEKQKQPPYRITVIDNSHLDKSSQQDLSRIKSSATYPHKQQSLSSPNKKPQMQSQKCCSFPESFRRQMLRMVFIPLLIVLFLLTIALTFKQNNYQTNDYFYSKNIEINRKIRGVVPPLNQTKQDIFGEYKIGLVQMFNIENRRMFEGWKVELWKNESMRITETGNNNQCWAMYKLKFYSSTIFISRIENHIYVDANITKVNRKLQNQTLENSNQTIRVDDLSQSTDQLSDKNNLMNSSEDNSSYQNESNRSKTAQNSSSQNSAKVDQDQMQQNPNSVCSVGLWSKLNKILYESHIWTFAEDNFYLLEFSQLGDDGNGVLIMRMLQKYLNPV